LHNLYFSILKLQKTKKLHWLDPNTTHQSITNWNCISKHSKNFQSHPNLQERRQNIIIKLIQTYCPAASYLQNCEKKTIRLPGREQHHWSNQTPKQHYLTYWVTYNFDTKKTQSWPGLLWSSTKSVWHGKYRNSAYSFTESWYRRKRPKMVCELSKWSPAIC
jgi:hypothetical protein